MNKYKTQITIDNATKCFNKLKQLGCPVFLNDDDESSYFRISGEYMQKNGSYWVEGYNDYTGEPYVDARIIKTLNEYGLDYEFYSSSLLNVYDN